MWGGVSREMRTGAGLRDPAMRGSWTTIIATVLHSVWSISPWLRRGWGLGFTQVREAYGSSESICVEDLGARYVHWSIGQAQDAIRGLHFYEVRSTTKAWATKR